MLCACARAGRLFKTHQSGPGPSCDTHLSFPLAIIFFALRLLFASMRPSRPRRQRAGNGDLSPSQISIFNVWSFQLTGQLAPPELPQGEIILFVAKRVYCFGPLGADSSGSGTADDKRAFGYSFKESYGHWSQTSERLERAGKLLLARRILSSH